MASEISVADRKVKPKKKTKFRLPKNFIWKLMQSFSHDLKNSVYGSHVDCDLETFDHVVRTKDIEKYLSNCKTQWGLKSQLVNTPLRSSAESEISRTRGRRLLTIFQKYDFPESLIDKRKRALDIFLKFERLCQRTNSDRIFVDKFDDDHGLLSTYDSLVTYKHLQHIRRFIHRTLGECPNLEEFLKALRHGPGASADKRGDDSIPIEKFVPPIGVSSSARRLFHSVLATDDRWKRSILELWCNGTDKKNLKFIDDDVMSFDEFLVTVDESTITTVPKSAEVDRTISIEPTANIYLQLAVDSIIRSALKRVWAIDINTQEKNQLLAKIGSLTDQLVTIDLSGASDSIALSWLSLFPAKWRKFLHMLRMGFGRLPDGTVVSFHKLSAMGNGFTFAVETLIFASMIYAVLRENGEHWQEHIANIAVYGDDIIIPKQFYSEYSYLLHRLGFRENVEKTFSHGPIRESCGRDYYNGFRIDRPTIKEEPKFVYELFILHNTFHSLGSLYGIEFDRTLDFILKYIPEDEKHYGPPTEDLVGWLFANSPPADVKKKYIKNWQGLYYNLKRNVVGHPTRYKDAFDKKKNFDITKVPRYLRYFVPMTFLDRGSNTHQNPCVRWLSNQSIVDWCKSLDSIAQYEKADYGLFFTKSQVCVRTSVTTIPYEEWR